MKIIVQVIKPNVYFNISVVFTNIVFGILVVVIYLKHIEKCYLTL